MVTCVALDSPPRASGRTRLVVRAAIAVIAVTPYLATLGDGFVFDDDTVIQLQEVVREHRFVEAFTTPYHQGPGPAVATGLYRPLTILSFAAQHALHDGRPFAFHAANVFLHALVSSLVLELALALAMPLIPAAVAAALFAAHPVHAEAVAGITGRAELLCSLFYISALLAYIRLRSAGGRVLTGGLVLLALLSKETAVTFPAAAVAWQFLIQRGEGVPIGAFVKRNGRDLATGAAAAVLPVTVYLLARRIVLGGLLVPAASVSLIENPLVGLPLPARLLSALAVLGRYVMLLVAPVRLSPDWGFAELEPVSSLADPMLLLGAAAALGAGCLFVVCLRGRRVVAWELAFGAATYSIVSNTVVTIGVGMAERLAYLPSTAFCLLLASCAAPLARRCGPKVTTLASGAVLIAALARTVAAAGTWRDDFTLFSAAERAAPRSVKVLGNLAVELMARGRLDEARARLERAAALAPDHVLTRINLSGVLLKAGDLAGAEEQIRDALRIEPRQPVALAQLGAILEKRGDRAGAEAALRSAVEIDPTFVLARLDLAGLLIAREAWDDAERELRDVLLRDPRSEAARRGLASIDAHRRSTP